MTGEGWGKGGLAGGENKDDGSRYPLYKIHVLEYFTYNLGFL